ncbi:maleylpyruvate isomerase N-terminal domain-containing protein [Streptomyces mirabilis]|uniref:maleylpyruvate isomerase N-terminal domain-containing protein n=1 Tax=Streptomyces mirabilis TaxID=68239 RepID=UPI0036C8FF7F
MTRAGIAAARSSTAQLAEIIPQVDDEQWELPSACGGWRVIDVVAHLAALASEAVDPPPPDPSLPKNRERYHDLRVDERRGWSHAEVLDEWRRSTPPAAGPPGSGPGTARGRRGRRGARARYISAPPPGEHHGVQRLLPPAQRHARPGRPAPVHPAGTDRQPGRPRRRLHARRSPPDAGTRTHSPPPSTGPSSST